MYKYGIAYYKVESGQRMPDTERKVRLVRPGEAWESGLLLADLSLTGFYEFSTSDPSQFGFYEIWDDVFNPPAFSGKCCFVGPLDSGALQPGIINNNHLKDGIISAQKLAKDAITSEHLNAIEFSLSKIVHEIQDEKDGEGDESFSSPAIIGIDNVAKHVLNYEYVKLPFVILVNHCAGHLYIANIIHQEGFVFVEVGLVAGKDTLDAIYNLLVISRD